MSRKPTYDELEQKVKALEKTAIENKYLEQIYHEIAQPVIILDLDQSILSANLPAQQLTGQTLKELVGKKCYQIFHNSKATSPPDLCPFQTLVSTRKAKTIEIEEETLNGTFLVSLTPVFDENGKLKRIIHISTDVTEKKKAEQELLASESKWRALVESAPDIIFTVDREGTILYINSPPSGLSVEEAIGTKCQDYVPPEYQETVNKSIQTAFQTGENSSIEIEARGPDDTLSWYTTKVSSIKQVEEIVSALFITRDITDRKQAEKNLIEEIHTRSILLDNIPGCIALILRKDTREIIASNKYAREIGAVPGTTCFATCAERDNNCPFCLAPELWATGQSQKMEVEYRGTWYEGIWVPLSEDLYVHYIFDITNRKLIEEALYESEEKYRSLLDDVVDSTEVGIFILDPDFRVVWVNKALENYFGLKKEEILGKDKRQLIIERFKYIFDDPERFAGKVLATYDDNTYTEQFECHALSNDKRQERWLEHRSQPVRSGFFSGGRAELYYDITDRKRAEEEIRRSKILLESSIESPEDMIILSLDREYRYQYFNNAHAESMKHVYGTLPQIGDCIFDHMKGTDDIEKVKEHYNRAFAGEGHIAIEEYGEGEVRFYYEIRYNPVYDENSEIVGVTAFAQNITERKRTEQALQKSETLLKEAQKVAHIGHWELDPAIGTPVWSDEIFRIFGLSPDEGEPSFTDHETHLHPNDWPILEKAVGKASVDGTPFDLTFRIVKPSGTIGWMHAIGTALLDEEGNVTKLFGTAQDITKNKQAEKKLQENEAFIKSVMDNLPIGIAVNSVDPAVKFEYMNDNFPKYYRATREALAEPDTFWNAVYEEPEFREEIKKRVLDDCASDDPERMYWVDVPITRKEDETSFITARNIPIPDKQLMISTVWDVTERKRAEEALQESEARHMSMVANISDVIGIIGVDGFMTYKSPNIEKWFGWKPQDLVGTDGWLTVHPEDLERIKKEFNTLLEKDKSVSTVEYRYKCKDGSYKWIELTATNLIHDPIIGGVLLNYHDITERKQAEAEQEKLQAQFNQAQKMESVGRLAGGVAHDYNNISSIIIGYSELALENIEQNTPLYDDLMEIYTAAKRSTDITRQLLAFARQQTIAPKVLDLNDTIESTLKMLRRLIGEDIDLAWLPGPGVWPVKLDPSQVDQIMANLCVNARDAIVDVGKVTIETNNISFDEDYCADHVGFVPGEYAMLSVSDDGSGIAPEALDEIFEPFFTTKDVGKGTGLGLATVYGIAKQNNGFINVYSELNKGTMIKIYLPRHTGKAVEAYNENTLEIPLSKGETVLLVEDDGSILKLGERMLENLGYVVLSANSPSEAIKLAEENAGAINLLITDVVMPEMNGRELSEQLQTLCPDLKTLFMSGYTADVIAHRGVLEDGVCFISKPFSTKDMAVKVREALDNDS